MPSNTFDHGETVKHLTAVIAKEVRVSYRLTPTQITLIKHLSTKTDNVSAIARAAFTTPRAVRRWRGDKTKTECSPGRPRTMRTPAVMQAIDDIVDAHAKKNKPMNHRQLRDRVARKTSVDLSLRLLRRIRPT